MFFALAALLWLPASAHCQIESLSGIDLFSCASLAAPLNGGSHGCEDNGCCAVEKSQYPVSQPRLTLPAPNLLPDLFAQLLVIARSLPAEVSFGVIGDAAPPGLKTWQFISRTALPARAPSLNS